MLWWMLTLQTVSYSLMAMRPRKSGVRMKKENSQPKSNWLGQCEIPSFVAGDSLIFF
ncbi:hypothetical protein CDL12_17573 [Handroanthus impetiginosus]|uniref:Uncharacterized protein n=1 Tax=Handroanthus impetiginosus TaxID=429701 RepID=A0A2G9GX30_9LAMI|nr:hypothetical protein CDL12_17573 [Handroanthus impetiginosus]